MKHRDNTTQSAQPGPAKRNRLTAIVAVILAILLVAEIGFQLGSRIGWRTYRGFDSVSAVAVDGHRQAWAVGYRQGRESLMTYTENGPRLEVPLPDTLTRAHPTALMIDSQDRVWVGTEFGRIGMRNPDGTWILFAPEEYGSDSTRQIIMDGQGRIWARSHRGPAELDPASSERTIRYTNSGMEGNDAVAMTVDSKGKLWVLTTKRELKVHEADGHWRTVIVVPASVRNGFIDAFLTIDPQGQVWMATVQGVGVWSPEGGWKEHPLGDPSRPLSLRGVLTDAEGRVWVAAWDQGLFRFDSGTGWTTYNGRNSALELSLGALALDPQGGIWLGSDQGALTRLNPDAALPVGILPALRFGGTALTPAILISLALLALMATVHLEPGIESSGQVIRFSLGFVAWYAVATLLWGVLGLTWPQPSGPVFFTINPLVVLAPVVHLILIVFLYRKQRQMARGALSAMVVNSIALLLMSPAGPLGSVGILFTGILFMMPFFLVL